jgi:hypothetical protein
MARMSATLRSGLVGISMKTARKGFSSAARTSSVREVST